MDTQLVQTRVFSLILSVVLALTFAIACEASSTTGTAGSGAIDPNVSGNTSGGQYAPGTSGSVTSGASGEVIVAAGNPANGTTATGGIAAGGNGPVSGSGEPTVCEAPIPNCAGLSGCELTICVLQRGSDEGQIPGDCSCLSGDRLAQCCAQVRAGMEKFNCLDLTEYPECEIKQECPMNVIESLKTNPYPGADAISQECVECLCTSCMPVLIQVASSDPSAVTLLQCAMANHVRKDCVVCNPPPCDNMLGTNLLTGPCNDELMASCPACSCSGPLDLNCLSLAGCLTESTVSTLPCRGTHMTLECLAANCPACPTLPDCPSNFGT